MSQLLVGAIAKTIFGNIDAIQLGFNCSWFCYYFIDYVFFILDSIREDSKKFRNTLTM